MTEPYGKGTSKGRPKGTSQGVFSTHKESKREGTQVVLPFVSATKSTQARRMASPFAGRAFAPSTGHCTADGSRSNHPANAILGGFDRPPRRKMQKAALLTLRGSAASPEPLPPSAASTTPSHQAALAQFPADPMVYCRLPLSGISMPLPARF